MNLAIVIPVYNEENFLSSLLYDMNSMLLELEVQYTIFAINNRSSDRSEAIIKEMAFSFPDIQLIQNNELGHGSSILKGYELATQYDWVFQYDSDYQYDLATFKKLWVNREYFDLLIAERENRYASFGRNIISTILFYIIKIFYGSGIKDINVPYRLMRGGCLANAINLINSQSFAPNTLISAYFIKKKLRIYKTECSLRQGIHLKKSSLSSNIFVGCIKSMFNLIYFRTKV